MRDDKEILAKILECIDRIMEYTKEGKDSFLADKKTQDAVVRNYQVIGEAVKDLSDDLKSRNADTEWREASMFRDKVIHHYLDVDYNLIWNAVEKALEPFREKVSDIQQRLVYKVPAEREHPPPLAQKLKELPKRKPEDVFKVKKPGQRPEPDKGSPEPEGKKDNEQDRDY